MNKNQVYRFFGKFEFEHTCKAIYRGIDKDTGFMIFDDLRYNTDIEAGKAEGKTIDQIPVIRKRVFINIPTITEIIELGNDWFC